MNLYDILFEPHVVIILISIIITVISYFLLNQSKGEIEEENEKNNKSFTLLCIFIISLLILLILKYGYIYLTKNNLIDMKGSGNDIRERLTIVADDVDFDVLE